jgi:diphthamide synthase (EF-2-diphthine--ammonia ligase)
MFGTDGARSKSHGLPPAVVKAQAEALALPSVIGRAAWGDYEQVFLGQLADLKEQGLAAGVFGDIESFLGRRLDWQTVTDLEAAGVDACGEEGEYHTVVTGGPLFANDLPVKYGEIVHHAGYGFLEVSL